MPYEVLALFLAAAANAFLSYIIVKGKRDAINILFSLFALSASLWAFFLACFILADNLFYALKYANFYYFFAAAIPVLLLYFSLYFRNKRGLKSKYIVFLLPWILLCLSFIFNENIIVRKIYEVNQHEKAVELNIFFYVVYTIYFGFYFASTYFFLFRKLRHSQKSEYSTQLKLIIWGTLLSYLFGMYFNLLLPLMGNYSLIWMGPLFSIFMIGSVGFAIIKYQLFDIRVIATQLFIFLLSGIVFVRLLFSSTSNDFIFNAVLFFATVILGIFLIKSVLQEVRAREEIEKLAKDLRVANARLNKVSMLKTEFVSLATHQLRSPLTAIKGYVSMILEGSYGPVGEKMREPLERVFSSTGTLAQIVQDFLDVSRIEQGSMKYDMKAFSLKDLAKEVVNEQAPNIDKAHLDFTFNFQDDDESGARYLVYGDRSKIKQVVTNLIDNALKYTKTGHISVQLSYSRHAVFFGVTDSGMGIDSKTLGALFQKFERADGADEVNVQGTGLGLYIARQIIEAHGGRIWAESEGLGKGTTFSVELKRKEF